MDAFHTELLDSQPYEGFAIKNERLQNANVKLLQDDTGVAEYLLVNQQEYHMLDFETTLHDIDHPIQAEFDIPEPCTGTAEKVLGIDFDLLTIQENKGWGRTELDMLDVVYAEEEVCPEAVQFAQLNTRIWDNYVYFHGTRYKLEASNRNEQGQFARTYKVIERVEMDELEDPDIFNPVTQGPLALEQRKWYRRINDDHRGLDFYDQQWTRDKVLLAEDVRVYPDYIEICCPGHDLVDRDYIMVDYLEGGHHEVKVDGAWLAIPNLQFSDEECEEAQNLLEDAGILTVTTLQRMRTRNVDSRDQHYDGGDPESTDDAMVIEMSKNL
jgi:hypothetical protein